MSDHGTGRLIAVRSARAVGGVVAVGALALVVAAASVLPLPQAGTTTAPSVTIAPETGPQRLSCFGPLLRMTDAGAEDAAPVAAVGTVQAVAGSTGQVQTSHFVAPDLAPAPTGSPARASSVTVDPLESGLPLVAAAQTQKVGLESLRGFAAIGCAPTSGEQWLVGGSTTVGRTTLLNLLNPTPVAAVVHLEVWGESGPIDASGASGITVPPGEQLVLPLSAFARDVAQPVVRVTSRGGQVVAALQHSVVRGLEPGGVETVPASEPPATRQVIPGVRIVDAALVQSKVGQEGYADLRPVLRMFMPEAAEAEVQVGIVPEDPANTGMSFAVHLDGGRVVDFPLEGLGDGRYSIAIESDASVIAAARISRMASTGSDFAWFTAAPALREEALVSIAPGPAVAPGTGPGPAPRLHVYNDGTDTATVEIAPLGAATTGEPAAGGASAGGTTAGQAGAHAATPDQSAGGTTAAAGGVTVQVPPAQLVSVEVTPGDTYRLSGFDSLYASIVYSAPGALSSYRVLPRALVAEAITVYP